MNKIFAGKVVLVTGAASGIGKVTARAFAEQGAKVVVSDYAEREGLESTRGLVDAGFPARFIKADVTKADEVKQLLSEIERVHGHLDCAINNAGVDGPRSRVADYPEDQWDEVVEVNLKGVFLCMKYEIPLMLRNGGGSIVNMASVAGVTGFVAHSAYTASKHGVIGLTKTAALEYSKSGLRVNAVCPCYTQTPMVERLAREEPGLQARLQTRIPLGRLGKPEEIAAAVLYLCGEQAAFITGQSLIIDGGIMAE